MEIKSINWSGHWEPNSGYGVHSYGLQSGFKKCGYSICHEPNYSMIADTLLTVDMPVGFKRLANAPFKNRIGCTVAECRVPELWVQESNMDYTTQIWVPSTFSKEMFANSGVIEDKIKVVPHGYDPDLFNEKAIPAVLPLPEDHFRFLFIGGYRGIGDRKGFDILCKAFSEEFSKDEKVSLIAKINKAYAPDLNIKKSVDSLNLPKNKPLIRVIEAPLKREQIPGLYKACDCLVIPSCSEGFCLPYLESLIMETPVIATNYGGHLDYLKDWKYLVDIEGMQAGTDMMSRQGEWAIPSVRHLRETMRYAYEFEKLIKLQAKDFKNKIKHMTWANSARIAKEYL